MADPLVSVIMPAFNCQPFIAQALSSVCSDPAHLEVVVVDDGSTDETATVVMGFGDPRVRLIQQSNQGLSAATNTGVRAARGKYIKLVDADDDSCRYCRGLQNRLLPAAGATLFRTRPPFSPKRNMCSVILRIRWTG